MSRRLLVLNERDPRHPQAGGAEVHLREIFRRLAAAGDAVTLLASGFPGGPAEEEVDGVRVLRLGAGRLGYYARVPGAYRRLRAPAPFDVVVEDLNKFPFFARFWVREPLVVLTHPFVGRSPLRQPPPPVARARVAARGGADRVELRGFVDEDEKVRLLQTAHVVACASEKEGWGLTVVEAAACGTPAVVTDVPGLRDAVRDGETGLLAPPGDPAALACALGRVLDDAALRGRLAAGAARWAARFDWDAAAAEVSAVLDAARGARATPGRAAGRA